MEVRRSPKFRQRLLQSFHLIYSNKYLMLHSMVRIFNQEPSPKKRDGRNGNWESTDVGG
jgi:hypothetical protein